MYKRESGPSRNSKPSVCFGKPSENNANENKKSIECKSNVSAKSANRSSNANESVVCEHEKNVSKSVCGGEHGMRRSNTSENNAWRESSNGWLDVLVLRLPNHRLCPRYWLTTGLSSPFPSHLSSRSTREKGSRSFHKNIQSAK